MLDASVLKTALINNLEVKGFNLDFEGSKTSDFIDALCAEIISHIANNGVITVPGVTTGTSSVIGTIS